MNKKLLMLAVCLFAAPVLVGAGPRGGEPIQLKAARLSEADRKITVGRILVKWGPYVQKVKNQDRRAWAASLWPSLQNADLANLQKALNAVTYEGMRNAVLGQRPYDDDIIDRAARGNVALKGGNVVVNSLGDLAGDLVFTPLTPCRIVDTRTFGVRVTANSTSVLDASNPGGNFTLQGGSPTDCGIPANPAALALSVTALNNLSTGFVRVYPYDQTASHGSPVPVPVLNTVSTNDIIVPACQGCTQELRVFSSANTHYAAFVTGYFMAPQATALDCTVAQDSGTLELLGGLQPRSVACPAGYAATGGGCGGPLGIAVSNSRPLQTAGQPTGWQCDLVGSLLSVISYEVNATCCRVPGR